VCQPRNNVKTKGCGDEERPSSSRGSAGHRRGLGLLVGRTVRNRPPRVRPGAESALPEYFRKAPPNVRGLSPPLRTGHPPADPATVAAVPMDK
jgi:hypothetical protein